MLTSSDSVDLWVTNALFFQNLRILKDFMIKLDKKVVFEEFTDIHIDRHRHTQTCRHKLTHQ